MNPTTALIIAAALAVVALVLVVWSAVEAVLWLEDHTKRIRALEEILEDQILEHALEEVALEHGLEAVELELVRARTRSNQYRLAVLEDTVGRLEELEDRLQATTITSHHHTPWSPLYDQDAPGVWADLTTAEEEV